MTTHVSEKNAISLDEDDIAYFCLCWGIADRNPSKEYVAAKEYISEHWDENEGQYKSCEDALAEYQSDHSAYYSTDWREYAKKPFHHLIITDMECGDIWETDIKIHGTDNDLAEYKRIIERTSVCRIK